MTGDSDIPGRADPQQDYRSLPQPVRLDDTIATVDPGPVPDPEAGRNAEQHRTLRDD